MKEKIFIYIKDSTPQGTRKIVQDLNGEDANELLKMRYQYVT